MCRGLRCIEARLSFLCGILDVLYYYFACVVLGGVVLCMLVNVCALCVCRACGYCLCVVLVHYTTTCVAVCTTFAFGASLMFARMCVCCVVASRFVIDHVHTMCMHSHV